MIIRVALRAAGLFTLHTLRFSKAFTMSPSQTTPETKSSRVQRAICSVFTHNHHIEKKTIQRVGNIQEEKPVKVCDRCGDRTVTEWRHINEDSDADKTSYLNTLLCMVLGHDIDIEQKVIPRGSGIKESKPVKACNRCEKRTVTE